MTAATMLGIITIGFFAITAVLVHRSFPDATVFFVLAAVTLVAIMVAAAVIA